MKTMNPYEVSWAILKAEKGVVRKKDIRLLDKTVIYSRQKTASISAMSKEKLKTLLQSNKGKFEKKYKVLIITDAQFGKIDYKKERYYGALEVATRKQIKEQFYIN